MHSVSQPHVPQLNVQWLSALGDHSVDSTGLDCWIQAVLSGRLDGSPKP